MAEQHKVGTRIVFSNGEELIDVTTGKEYTIAGIDSNGDEYFTDDVGDDNYAAATGQSWWGCKGSGKYEVLAN